MTLVTNTAKDAVLTVPARNWPLPKDLAMSISADNAKPVPFSKFNVSPQGSSLAPSGIIAYVTRSELLDIQRQRQVTMAAPMANNLRF